MTKRSFLPHWILRPGQGKKKHASRRTRRLGLEPLEMRAVFDVHLPDLVGVNDMNSGKDQFIPLQGADDQSQAIIYTPQVTSTGNAVTATVLSGGQSLRLTVTGKDGTGADFTGVLEFRLFEDDAPLATARIKQLVQQSPSFFNNVIFHRIINNFMAQGGDPTGTGGGGSPLDAFNDEFKRTSTFTSRGLLAMANSGDDSNDSQFFIVDTDILLAQLPQHLNFNHTIFGVLTKGQEVLAKMMSTPTTGNPPANPANRPLTNVTITASEIFTDTAAGVLRIHTPDNFTGNFTVSVTASNGGTAVGDSVTKQIALNATADTINDRPFLGTVVNQTTNEDTPVTFNLQGIDLENDLLTFVVRDSSNFNLNPTNVTANIVVTPASGSTPASAAITLTPAANFNGTLTLILGVRDGTIHDADSTLNSRANFDTQTLLLTVLAVNDKPTGTAQTLTTPTSTALNGTLAGDDGDPTVTQTLTFEIVSQPGHGAISNLNAQTGTFTYTPTGGFNGVDTFTYRVKDNGGVENNGVDTSDTFTVTINVGLPAAPTALDLVTASDNGLSTTDNLTSIDKPTITVQAEAGATVQLFVNGSGTGIAMTEVSGTPGTFTTTLAAGVLKNGANTMFARATRNSLTSVDSSTLTVTLSPALEAGYRVPGTVGAAQTLRAHAVARNAGFNNEIGYFKVDDETGKIGNLQPGTTAWLREALSASRRHVLVGQDAEAGDLTTNSVTAGDWLVFYLVADGTATQLLARNWVNEANYSPHVFFSLQTANPDDVRHTNMVGDSSTGDVQVSFEDLYGGGDRDFNDAVVALTLSSTTTANQVGEAVKVPTGTGTTTNLTAKLETTSNSNGSDAPASAAGGEFGVFPVSDAQGRVNNILPGASGYLAAALNPATKRVLFNNGDVLGTSKMVAVDGGALLGFYYIPGGTSASLLAGNANNSASGSPVAFFSFDAGNPDSQAEHFRWFGPESSPANQLPAGTDDSTLLMHVMDELGGGSSDFDDFLLSLKFSA